MGARQSKPKSKQRATPPKQTETSQPQRECSITVQKDATGTVTLFYDVEQFLEVIGLIESARAILRLNVLNAVELHAKANQKNEDTR